MSASCFFAALAIVSSAHVRVSGSPVPNQADPVAPATYEVTFNTDLPADPITGSPASAIVVTVTRKDAPLGADRFYALVNAGFYNDSAFFRVVPNFVVQYGISGSAAENEKWLHNPINDDPVLASNTDGTVTFATAGPNTRTSQIFINFGDNSRLDKDGFAPFGKVTAGYDSAQNIVNPTPGNSGGVDQTEYERNGNAWIKKTYPGINFITDASVTSTSHQAQADVSDQVSTI